MSFLVLTIGTIAVLLVLIYKCIIVPTCLSPLSPIPNAHFTSPIAPTWIWWQRRTGFETRSIFAAHQRHGPIVRLGPNELSVASLDGLRQVYTAGFEKDPWYIDEFMNYQTPNLVSMLQHKPHSVQKRMITNVYSKSSLQNSPDLQTLSSVLLYGRFLPLLYSVAKEKTGVNVLEIFQAAGMDFMSAYLFGLTNSTDFLRNASARQRYFRLYRTKSHRLPGAESATQEIESLCLSMCQAAENFSHQNPSATPPSTSTTPSTNPVVCSQLSSQLTNSPSPFQPSRPKLIIIASELLDHLIASHETSGITLTYLLYELSRRPTLQSALRAELLTLSPPLAPQTPSNGAESRPPALLPSPHAIDNLPLLNAILYETLRLYAAAPAPQPRITPAGTTIEGYRDIPAGVRISTSAYCMHRNADAYPDPLAFNPERWLQGEKGGMGGTKEMRRWFWAFGSGGRMCLGSNFALQMIKLLVAATYTNFATAIVDDEGMEQMDAYIAMPVGNKLVLRFERVPQA
ncbi:hypothetical protein MMC08_005535 [Hypocenomyce scalaris]|nr:hypothetical protein [Hypocenomyce scalaris]